MPTLDGAIWHANNWKMRASWLYQAADQKWTRFDSGTEEGDFQRNAPPPEQVGYYDPGRNIIVAQSERNTYHFDVAKQRWQRVLAAESDADHVPFGHDARSVFYHDPASGHGLLLEFRGSRLWAYNPDDSSWRRLDPAGEPMPSGRKRLAYMDVARGVLVVILDKLVWAYRYDGDQAAASSASEAS